MMLQPREPAVAESYLTFWNETPRTYAGPQVPVEDAYTAFVNLTEGDLPAETFTDAQ
jgi:hypothetical protein